MSSENSDSPAKDPSEGIGAVLACTALSMLACGVVFLADTLVVNVAAMCVSITAAIVAWRYARRTTGNHTEQ